MCQRRFDRSSSTVTASAAKPAHVTKGAPCARRQRLQWQCATHFEGSAATKPTSPHRQLPREDVAMAKCGSGRESFIAPREPAHWSA
jgi:hypothetical protein